MTQAELAKALGVYQSAITQWENGLTSPRLDKLQAMAALFKCSIDELVGKDVGNEIPADLMDGE